MIIRQYSNVPRKTFIVPEVIYDPSLFLSPHVFLLAILFRRRAFWVDKLNDDPTLLNRLKVPKKEVQLPIPLKEELDDKYIFCAAERLSSGYEMTDARITYSTMNGWLRRVGEILGWETNARPYILRYMAGNNMNECGMSHPNPLTYNGLSLIATRGHRPPDHDLLAI